MRDATVTHDAPASPWILYWIGRLFLTLFGFDVTGEVPPGRKFVLIGAPHTSNWDLPFMLAAAWVFRVRIQWLGKHTLFWPPLGWLLRALGGRPIDRSTRHGAVQAIANQITHSQQLLLAIPPSGTRSKRDHWKSGFYWIAHAAQVPILCGYLDYARREAHLGLHMVPTGQVSTDMNRIRAFYRNIRGKYPELESTIRLKDEPKES